jgi:putative transposase
MSDTLRCRKVYRFRLEPRGSQDLELERRVSVSRFIYNWGLDRCQTYYQAQGKSLPWSQLSRELTELKSTEPWLYDFDSQMLQQALANLERVYVNFFAGRAKVPKFKKKKSARQPFRIPQRVKVSDGYVSIPTIGKVKLRQSEVMELPTKSATFKRHAVGHWFVTLVAEFEMLAAKVPIREEKVVGLDAVLQPPNYLVGSDGSEIPAPRYYRRMERKLRRAHRHLSRCQKRSHNRSQARLRVARVHERVANLRKRICASVVAQAGTTVGRSMRGRSKLEVAGENQASEIMVRCILRRTVSADSIQVAMEQQAFCTGGQVLCLVETVFRMWIQEYRPSSVGSAMEMSLL